MRWNERMVRDAFTMMSSKSHHHKNYDNFFFPLVPLSIVTLEKKFRNVFPNYYPAMVGGNFFCWVLSLNNEA